MLRHYGWLLRKSRVLKTVIHNIILQNIKQDMKYKITRKYETVQQNKQNETEQVIEIDNIFNLSYIDFSPRIGLPQGFSSSLTFVVSLSREFSGARTSPPSRLCGVGGWLDKLNILSI